ncbi:MAG: choice-of-anchor tandem repeat NxxGxxAF-containing protein [Candidatus Sulfotelmatobacter sp.]|jgi:hypothetical protein
MFAYARTHVLVMILGLSSIQALAQSAFTYKKLVDTGETAPAPHEMGEILESSFDDHGLIVYGADNGLFYDSEGKVNLFGFFDQPAPGGGKFSASWSSNLSSTGKLLFRGEVTSPGVSGLFMYAGGKITSVIPDGTVASNGVAVSAYYPVISSNGDFAFLNEAPQGLYLDSKGTITPIAVAGQAAPGGGTFNVFSQYAINKSDQVAFISFLSPSGEGLYLASGGTITKIIATGDTFSDGSAFAFPDGVSINESGQVAFGGVNNNGSEKFEGLFQYSGGQYNVILSTGTTMPDGSTLNFPFAVSINNAGQIAFGSSTIVGTSTGLGTYIFSAGNLTEVAVSGESAPNGDVFSDSGEYNVQINDSGQVLLLSPMTYHADALFSFSARKLTYVAGEGDHVSETPAFEYPTPVAIAANNEVLFSDFTFPGGSGYFLVSPQTGNHVSISFVANSTTSVSDGDLDYIQAAAMNDSGEVAMVADTSEDYGNILLDSGTGLNVVAGGPSSSVSPSQPLSINNSGQVAFYGYGSSGSGVFLYSDGQSTLLPGTSGFLSSLAVNDSDAMAFFSTPTPPNQSGIYSYANGVVTGLALNGQSAPGGGDFSYSYGSPRFGPVINESGATAFAAPLSVSDDSGIFLSANGTLSRIVGTGDLAADGSTFETVDSPSINASGEIAFWGATTSEIGIFVYGNGAITKVAGTGDVIGKETLAYLDYPRITDSGDIAFLSLLSDGTTAIYLAQPPTKENTKKMNLTLTSSRPLRPNAPLVMEMRGRYERAVAVRTLQLHHAFDPHRNEIDGSR